MAPFFMAQRCLPDNAVVLAARLPREDNLVSDAFLGDNPDARPGVGRERPLPCSVAPEGGVP